MGMKLGGMHGGGCGCCGGCAITICTKGCGVPLSGVLVTVTTTGGAFVSSGTTVSPSACVGLTIPAAGRYNITTVYGSISMGPTGFNLTCGVTINISIDPSGLASQCCNNCLIPDTLTLTDALGPLTLTAIGTTWQGSRVITATILNLTGFNGTCTCTQVTGDLMISYIASCLSGGNFQVTRTWPIVGCTIAVDSTCLPPLFYWDSTSSCGPCFTGQPCDCPAMDAQFLSQPWSSCNPFVWSGTLGGSLSTPDPVGGTVTVTS